MTPATCAEEAGSKRSNSSKKNERVLDNVAIGKQELCETGFAIADRPLGMSHS